MKRIGRIAGGIVGGLLAVAGCKSTGPCGGAKDAAAEPFVARHAKAPIVVDGKLDDPAWQSAVSYPTCSPKKAPERLASQAYIGNVLREGGKVRFAWDEEYLYIGVEFVDSDVAAEGKNDQEHHYSMGDVMEVFLKPDNQSWYWELYATPHNKKTTFFFPGRGRLFLPSSAEYRCDLKVGATVDGTLNNWEDRDNGWSAEMAVPVKALTERGVAFGPGSSWRVLVGRYNYSRYLPQVELSCCPQLSVLNYHLLEEYGYLKFEK